MLVARISKVLPDNIGRKVVAMNRKTLMAYYLGVIISKNSLSGKEPEDWMSNSNPQRQVFQNWQTEKRGCEARAAIRTVENGFCASFGKGN